jgi:hypothetical protein
LPDVLRRHAAAYFLAPRHEAADSAADASRYWLSPPMPYGYGYFSAFSCRRHAQIFASFYVAARFEFIAFFALCFSPRCAAELFFFVGWLIGD